MRLLNTIRSRKWNAELLILHVHGGEDTPYYYIGDSVLETFVRIGNESVVADSTEHKRLVLRGRNSSFDARFGIKNRCSASRFLNIWNVA